MARSGGGAGGRSASSSSRTSTPTNSSSSSNYSRSSNSSSRSYSGSSSSGQAMAYAQSRTAAEVAAEQETLRQQLLAAAAKEQATKKAALIKRVQEITGANNKRYGAGPNNEPIEESYDYTNGKGPIEESYDYTPKSSKAVLNQYLGRGRNWEKATYTQPQTQPMQTDLARQIADLQAKLEKAVTAASSIDTKMNPVTANYPTAAEQVATIAANPISSNGDIVIPGLGLLEMQSANETAQAEAALNNYIAGTNAQIAKSDAVNEALQGLSDLLGTVIADENADQTHALNATNSQFDNEQTAMVNALTRIIAGTGSRADYELLGIPYGTVPYEQSNFLDNLNLELAKLANEQRKTELYGLGLTV